MSADQNQHYLPQSYQRGWANDNGLVHVYRYHHDKLVCDLKPTKATGAAPGLYFTPMAPEGQQNAMEDQFWSKIDQWGADALKVLRSTDPAVIPELKKERFAIFALSLCLRNPSEVRRLNDLARDNLRGTFSKDDYAAMRRSHEPDTYEEFVEMLDQPGLTEHGSDLLKCLVLSDEFRHRFTDMDWQVVTVKDYNPLLTSDVPVLRYKGLDAEDALFMLPLSPTEFFVAYNVGGRIDMKRSIEENIRTGVFVTSMNKMTVRQKHKYVYAADDSQGAFVARYWSVKEEPWFRVFKDET